MFCRRVVLALLLVLVFGSADLSIADQLKKAYDAGYEAGCSHGGGRMKSGRCFRGAGTGTQQIGGITAFKDGMVVFGGTGSEPVQPGTHFIKLPRWMFSKTFIESPLVTEEVRQAIKDGREIGLSGFTFGSARVLPGKGTVSFAPGATSDAIFRLDEGLNASLTMPNRKLDWTSRIRALQDDGLRHGFIAKEFFVKQ